MMMPLKLLLGVLLAACTWLSSETVCAADKASAPLVLSATSLGPLKLSENARVSEQQLRQLFPKFLITYEIAQGDSPDFYYFEVKKRSGELMFSIKSFILEEGVPKKVSTPVKIDLLQVYSKEIRDQYGVRVGMTMHDVEKRRGRGLHFGHAHHDVWLGDKFLFYLLETDSDEGIESVKKEAARKQNGRVLSISWPGPAWDR